MVDLWGMHVSLVEGEVEFFLHVQCFLDGDWMRDNDITGRAVATSMINTN